MNLTARTDAAGSNERKRQMGRVKRNFFAWFLDNGDPSADDIAEVSLVQFRSVQDGIYAFKKAHMHSTPSVRSFPNVAFETGPEVSVELK